MKTLTQAEHAAVLAGLRMLERGLLLDNRLDAFKDPAVPQEIEDILTDGGAVEPFNPNDIDALCQKLNVQQRDELAPRFEWTKPLYEAGPDDNPGARLYGSLDIAGVGHHMEAIEVKRDNEGIWQSVLHPEADTNFEAVLQATDYPLAAVTIQGREYVLLVVPGEE